jgi:hypothetical protein
MPTLRRARQGHRTTRSELGGLVPPGAIGELPEYSSNFRR